MKRLLLILLITILTVTAAFAQTEVATDTLRQETGNIPPAEEQLLPEGTRNYGGFLIDMNSLIKMPTPDLNQSFKIVIPNASKTTASYSGSTRTSPTRRGLATCSAAVLLSISILLAYTLQVV